MSEHHLRENSTVPINSRLNKVVRFQARQLDRDGCFLPRRSQTPRALPEKIIFSRLPSKRLQKATRTISKNRPSVFFSFAHLLVFSSLSHCSCISDERQSSSKS